MEQIIDSEKLMELIRKGMNLTEIAETMSINKSSLSIFIKHTFGGWKEFRRVCIFGKKDKASSY